MKFRTLMERARIGGLYGGGDARDAQVYIDYAGKRGSSGGPYWLVAKVQYYRNGVKGKPTLMLRPTNKAEQRYLRAEAARIKRLEKQS